MEVNITLLSVVVIVLLFIPGFFFKRFYYSGQFTKQFYSGTFAERFVTNVFWGIVVQCITLYILGKWTNYRYNDIRTPLTDFCNELKDNKIPVCTSFEFFACIYYIAFSIIIAIMLGWFSHLFVRFFRLDVKFPVLRFANHWNYYFKGDLPHLRTARSGKVVFTDIDLIVEVESGKTTLYRGVLADFTPSPTTGDLELLILAQSERWSQSSNSFKPIPGDALIIPYNTVRNMNVRYRTITETLKERLEPIVVFLLALILLLVLIGIPIYYYGRLKFLRIAAIVIASLLEWFFVVVFAAVPFVTPASSQRRYVKNVKKLATGIFITMAILAYFIWHLS